jgi:uracil-DNA glycosylase
MTIKERNSKTEMDGGPKLQRLLNGVPGISIDDVWLADAIKCPVNNSRAGDVDSDEAFDHCSEYLEREIAEVDPELILAMGAAPGEQVLEGYFGLCLNWLRTGSRDTALRTGSRDAGRIFDTDPPVVVSPHWSSKGNWLDRNNNRENVQIAIREVLDYRD